MSMIPFEWDGTSPTVVLEPEKWDINKKAILMVNMNLEQFSEPGESNATYDLRIGPQYRDHRDGKLTELQTNDSFTLFPNSAVVVTTEESVHFPKWIFGY